MAIDRNFVLRRANVVLLIAALGAFGCGADVPDGAAAGDPAGSTAEPVSDAAPASGTSEQTDRTTTAEWSERRLIAEVDAAFPHSEHRTVECERCHQRPATHVTHTEMECVGCHARPAGFASLPDRSRRECASCHHADTERSCRSCHQTDEVGPLPVLATVKVGSSDNVRVRKLSFAHSVHASRDCRSCHDDPVTRHFEGDCSSCHAEHHTRDASCATCHADAAVPAHTNAVHAGCAGGGCHEDAVVLALQPTRNVCLTCHAGLAPHKPGQECTTCHVGFTESLAGGSGAP